MATNQIKAITLSSTNSASVTGTYAAINTTGLGFACFLLKIINGSGEDITVSYDGTTDHDYVVSNTTLEVQGNTSQPNGSVSTFSKGTRVYIKGTASTGFIRLIGYYNPT